MTKKWSGDHQYQLPEKMVEPYRLWFYALQLAYRVDGLKINKKFYKEWGEVEGIKFGDWWRKNWRNLFGVSLGVRQIENDTDYTNSVDGDSMIVRIPFNQSWSKTENELKTILETKPVTEKKLGKFYLTNSKRIDRRAIRLSLKAFEYRLNGYDPRQTAIRITNWYESKNNITTYPSSLYDMGKALLRGETIDATSSTYRSASRIIKRGERIVRNVAKGEFLGKY
jgi:hypothetical protein